MQRYLFLLIPAAILLRFYLSTLGHNYDMESFERVAWAGWRGESVYAATDRYNYAPFWFWALTGLKYLQIFFVGEANSLGAANFHLWVTGLVVVGELFMCWVLRLYAHSWKIPLAALVFSPLCLLLTGYHSQFDVWALALGAWGWQMGVLQGRWIGAGVLVGLSLCVKHWLFFLPPLLLLLPALSWRERFGFIGLAYGLFLLSFSPFLGEEMSRAGILRNVFGYSSAEGIALLPFLLHFLGLGATFFKLLHAGLVLGVCVLQLRKVNAQGLIWVYLLVFVAASPAMATQYLYAPALGLFMLGFWRLGWAFSLLSAAFLLLRSPTNIGEWAIMQSFYAEYMRPPFLWNAVLSVYALQGFIFAALIAYFLRFLRN